jgi:hypothetical protein
MPGPVGPSTATAPSASRDLSPDTGTGAELYAVIGQPPRQLDRNIAVVGRVIEGIVPLLLPRAPGNGVYKDAADRTPILSVRLASDLPADQQPHSNISTQSAISPAMPICARTGMMISSRWPPMAPISARSRAHPPPSGKLRAFSTAPQLTALREAPPHALKFVFNAQACHLHTCPHAGMHGPALIEGGPPSCRHAGPCPL